LDYQIIEEDNNAYKSIIRYMLLRTEESLFLPPLIPAKLHIFWAVGLWEGQSGV